MLEIERKYLVNPSKWTPKTEGAEIMQGYLSTDKQRVVRVRTKGEKAFLTVKGNQKGIVRTEFEYDIPLHEAKEMLKMCLAFPIEKIRYEEEIDGLVWEIDVFKGKNKGLLLAEVELENEYQEFTIPNWVQKEVSNDYRYFNSWLSKNPFSAW